MQSDFSTAGKAMRDAIPAPTVPMAAILQRSADTNVRDRLRAIIATVVFGLGLGTAGVVGAKIYGGISYWIHGYQAVVQMQSTTIFLYPTEAELKKVLASASFPVTLPVGLPKGTLLWGISYAPEDHPTSIAISYFHHGLKVKPTIVLIDPAIVNDGPMPGVAQSVQLRDPFIWHLPKEVVLVPKESLSQDEAASIQSAMSATSPDASLLASRPLLASLVVLASRPGSDESVALIAAGERYAIPGQGSILLDSMRLAISYRHQAEPIPDSRKMSLSHMLYHKEGAEAKSWRWSTQTAVPLAGVHAIHAAFAAAKMDQENCKCAALYSQPTPATHSVWIIPLSGAPARHYLVDARGRATLAT